MPKQLQYLSHGLTHIPLGGHSADLHTHESAFPLTSPSRRASRQTLASVLATGSSSGAGPSTRTGAGPTRRAHRRKLHAAPLPQSSVAGYPTRAPSPPTHCLRGDECEHEVVVATATNPAEGVDAVVTTTPPSPRLQGSADLQLPTSLQPFVEDSRDWDQGTSLAPSDARNHRRQQRASRSPAPYRRAYPSRSALSPAPLSLSLLDHATHKSFRSLSLLAHAQAREDVLHGLSPASWPNVAQVLRRINQHDPWLLFPGESPRKVRIQAPGADSNVVQMPEECPRTSVETPASAQIRGPVAEMKRRPRTKARSAVPIPSPAQPADVARSVKEARPARQRVTRPSDHSASGAQRAHASVGISVPQAGELPKSVTGVTPSVLSFWASDGLPSAAGKAPRMRPACAPGRFADPYATAARMRKITGDVKFKTVSVRDCEEWRHSERAALERQGAASLRAPATRHGVGEHPWDLHASQPGPQRDMPTAAAKAVEQPRVAPPTKKRTARTKSSPSSANHPQDPVNSMAMKVGFVVGRSLAWCVSLARSR